MWKSPGLIQAMRDAWKLIETFRNTPESIYNNAKQVDPIIRALRVELAELEREQNKTL